jgi:hypothetical protein
MKPLLAPLACGTLAAALLYGLLWTAERKVAEPEDPWLDGWLNDGLKAEFRSASSEPDHHLMLNDARELFETGNWAGTALRNYIVQNTSVQLVQLPKARLVPSLPEGRILEYKYRAKSIPVHYCRVGRWMLIVATSERSFGPIIPISKTTKDRAQQLFDSFEQTAGRYP